MLNHTVKIKDIFKESIRLFALPLNSCPVQDLVNIAGADKIFQSDSKTLYVLRASHRITINGLKATLQEFASDKSQDFDIECPFDFLGDVYDHYKNSISIVPLDSHRESLPTLPAFIGYLGFALTESSLNIPRQKQKFANLPDSIMEIPSLYIVADELNGRASIISDRGEGECLEIASMIGNLKDCVSTSACAKSQGSEPENFEMSISDLEYEKMVERTKEFVREGEAFQIVLSRRFSVNLGDLTARSLYERVRSNSGSPYTYYLDYGSFQYTGASPESQIKIQDGVARFRALAGTRPRGTDEAEETRMESELTGCPKEKAEHMMLVDLGRNDLGRVCRSGSIKVKNLMSVVKYPQVMHLSTDLEGSLEESATVFETVKSCFPRGTVSGAPKKRALEILSSMEEEQRGIYSGAVGIFDLDGGVDLAIAIRSATIVGKRAHVQAGAGIVYDSIAKDERKETLNKAASILDLIYPSRSWRSLKPEKKEKEPAFSGASDHDHSSNRQL